MDSLLTTPRKRFSRTLVVAALALTLVSLAGPNHALADPAESVLWSFGAGSDGQYPYASLVADGHGNLYGTTYSGGKYGDGTVFKLAPPSGKHTQWSESVLWSFGATASDGENPYSALPLIADGYGNLYGTTISGGSYGYGTVFKLAPPSRKQTQWSESVLWSFGANATDGQEPVGGLIEDAHGNLYGTTFFGGAEANAYGTVFKLAPPSGKQTQWSENVLWNFGADSDGAFPEGGVIIDGRGNLYSTTLNGGIYGSGTVFELAPPSRKQTQWSENILWSFGAAGDGLYPQGGLIADARGNLYSATFAGGAYGVDESNGGTVFMLTPPSGKQTQWRENILWNFGAGSDGSLPYGGVIIDGHGILYGTTGYGGAYTEGTVFKLAPPSGKQTQWSENVLWSFGGAAIDGEYPIGGVTIDRHGNLYGTTALGGVYSGAYGPPGTVFEVCQGGC